MTVFESDPGDEQPEPTLNDTVEQWAQSVDRFEQRWWPVILADPMVPPGCVELHDGNGIVRRIRL